MRAASVALILAIFLTTTVAAQEPSRFAWAPSHQDEARSLSDALAGSQAALYAKHVWDAPDRKRAIGCAAARAGVTFAATAALKHFVHSERPDGSGDDNMPSGHASSTMAWSGWNYAFGIPISLTTGALRIAANRHTVPAVLAGWGIGAAAQLICRGNDGGVNR